MCGFITQLVEHCTSITEVMGSNPSEALIFFRLLLSNCLNWKVYCDDHSSLSSTTAVELFHIYFTSLPFMFQLCQLSIRSINVNIHDVLI